MEKIGFKLTGVAPILMHNAQLCDPRNEWKIKIKVITDKKNKSDADLEDLRRYEWEGGLYLDPTSMKIAVPGEVMFSAIVEGAKKSKNGKKALAGIVEAEPFFELEHDGSEDLDSLYEDGRFVDIRSVKVQRNRVMRCRPIFLSWKLRPRFLFNPKTINQSAVISAMESCGKEIGIGDYRPRFGRFTVEML